VPVLLPMPRSVLLPLLCALAILASAAGAPAASAGCGPARLVPRHANLARVAQITFCLLNSDRIAHGLRPLHRNGALARAAAGHSSDMVARGYFSHDALSVRVSRSGYPRGHRLCAVGENIAAATGPYATPAAIVKMWLQSPGHRANILARSFRDGGIGVAYGYPGAHGWRGATYTEDFGSRC
jgi:uncharacterized protein YkwD